MLDLDNRTPFQAALVPFQDKTGRDAAVLVLKGTFTVGVGGAVATLSDLQQPILRADSFYGEPAESSVKYEADTCPGKVGTDIVLVGYAYGPPRATRVDVELRAGALRKLVHVTGDRHFGRSAVGWHISDPAPIDRVPLMYERAFGGEDKSSSDPQHHEWEQRNPVGVGFAATNTQKSFEGQRLPNLEHPSVPMQAPTDRPPPVGFGFVARHWMPRRSHAGTMDDRWQREQAPLLPVDFDERFHHGAPADQMTASPMRGGERLWVSSVLPGGGALDVLLPSRRIGVSAKIKDRTVECETKLDTVVLDADERRLTLVWRAVVPCGRELLYVDRVTVTDATA